MLLLQAIADLHVDLSMQLAIVLKQVWLEADRWNEDQKRAIAALSCTADGAVECLDRLSVALFFALLTRVVQPVPFVSFQNMY